MWNDKSRRRDREYTEKTKKKVVVLQIEVNQFQRHKTFEIKLPSYIKRVTGIAVSVKRD